MPYDPTDNAQVALVERVEYRADQVTAEGQTVAINRSSIYEELEEAALWVLRKAPREVILTAATDGTAAANTSPTSAGGRLSFALPDDYLRFVRLRLTSWSTAVDALVSVNTSMYRLQANEYARADATYPMAVLVPDFSSSSNQGIEAFPGEDGADPVELLAYVGETAPELVPEELHDAMVWNATGRILQSTRQGDAGSAYEMGTAALAGLMTGERGEDDPQVG